MFQSDISRSIHEERTREIDRRIAAASRRDAARAFIRSGGEQRSIRRSIGRSIIRIGTLIAAEAGQPVATS